MRDFIVLAIVFGSIPVILLRPHVGIIMWSWLAYMNPHRLSWGFANHMPLAMIVAITTILAWLISRESKKVPWDGLSGLMMAFVLWTGFTTLFALEPEDAYIKWLAFNKVMLMTFLTMILMQSRERLLALVWITVLSIGFFGVKGGYFTIVTGGSFRVWGPPGTYIEDNNALALAILMIAPLMYYLAQRATRKTIRLGMYAALVLSIVTVVGTYSRGGLLGLGAMLLFLWWRSRAKMLLGGLLVIAVIFALPMMPQKWFDRMDTIQNYEQEGSAMDRLAIWSFALRLAAERPIIGGGFNVFQGRNGTAYNMLDPDAKRRNVHSIYFEVLGEQGVIGLLLFLAIGIKGLRTAGWMAKRTKERPDLVNEYNLARLIHVGLIAYAVSGAFQNLAHLDLYYNLLAMLVLARRLVLNALDESAPQQTPLAAEAGPVTGAFHPARIPSFLKKNAGHREADSPRDKTGPRFRRPRRPRYS